MLFSGNEVFPVDALLFSRFTFNFFDKLEFELLIESFDFILSFHKHLSIRLHILLDRAIKRWKSLVTAWGVLRIGDLVANNLREVLKSRVVSQLGVDTLLFVLSQIKRFNEV